jgi:hypothetical protein
MGSFQQLSGEGMQGTRCMILNKRCEDERSVQEMRIEEANKRSV